VKPTGAALAAASLLLVAAARCRCDEPSIVADRPGFGESASVVPLHRLQVETGAAFTWLGGGATVLDGPEALLRFGLFGPLEVRVAPPDGLRAHDSGATATGATDTSVGLKAHAAWRGHDVSLRATAYLPTGSVGQSSERVDPEVGVAWSHSLAGPWSLGATVGERWLRAAGTAVLFPSVSVGRALGGRAGTFVEYGALLSADIAPVHRFDHGYTWNPGPRTQLDVSGGVVVSRAPTAYFVGAGLCHRF
jgi:hypothetical protein